MELRINRVRIKRSRPVICVVFIKNRFFPDVFRSSSFSAHLNCFHKQRGKLREKLQKGNATLDCSLSTATSVHYGRDLIENRFYKLACEEENKTIKMKN